MQPVEKIAAIIIAGLRLGDYRFDGLEAKERAEAAGSTPEVMFAIDSAERIIKECQRRKKASDNG